MQVHPRQLQRIGCGCGHEFLAYRFEQVERFLEAPEFASRRGPRQREFDRIARRRLGLIQQRQRVLVQAKPQMRLSDRLQQFGAHGGLVLKLRLDTLGATCQKFARGDVFSLTDFRVGQGEQAGHEAERGTRLAGFLLRQIALRARLVRLPDRRAQSRCQGQ